MRAMLPVLLTRTDRNRSVSPGTIELARGLVTGREAAIDVAVTRWAGSTPEENLQLPAVQDRLRQRRNTITGLVLIGVGFLLQFIAAWP